MGFGLGGLIGGILGVGGDSGAQGTLGHSLAEFDKLNPPSVEEQKVKLEELVQQGVISPEDAQAILQEGTGLKEISTDPRLRSSQMAALSSLEDLAHNGGMSVTDKANLQAIQDSNAQAERGSREAILQNAKARGIGGSGLELAAQLQNQQGSATRNSQQGLGVASMAEQRALDALMKSGQLSGDIRAQDYGEAAKAAEAQDAINRFNAANMQNVGLANTQMHNQTQAANLAEKQRLADTNTQLRNQGNLRNADLLQQQFQNKLNIAAGKAGAYDKIAQSQDNAKAQDNQFAGSLLGTAGLVTAGALAHSDERVKEHVTDGSPDLESFLSSLTSNKYDYKGPMDDGQKHVSVMAQDLEKTPVGRQAVRQDSHGIKMVNYLDLLPAIVASLGHLHKKVEGRHV